MTPGALVLPTISVPLSVTLALIVPDPVSVAPDMIENPPEVETVPPRVVVPPVTEALPEPPTEEALVSEVVPANITYAHDYIVIVPLLVIPVNVTDPAVTCNVPLLVNVAVLLAVTPAPDAAVNVPSLTTEPVPLKLVP